MVDRIVGSPAEINLNDPHSRIDYKTVAFPTPGIHMMRVRCHAVFLTTLMACDAYGRYEQSDGGSLVDRRWLG